MDIVIGSSTIYPVFPSRELKNLRVGNEDKPDDQLKVASTVRIIDGGFIHNRLTAKKAASAARSKILSSPSVTNAADGRTRRSR